MKLIAITGMAGSGKTEFSNFFKELNYEIIRFGDITEDILKARKMEINEENEKKVRNELREKYGMEAYAKANLEKIESALKEKNVVIDGLYSWEEYKFLKARFPDMIIVAIYAPPEIRYERLVERNIRSLTREQAIKRDYDEIEQINKAGPIVMADYTVLNVGTLFDLRKKFNEFIEWMREQDEARMG